MLKHALTQSLNHINFLTKVLVLNYLKVNNLEIMSHAYNVSSRKELWFFNCLEVIVNEIIRRIIATCAIKFKDCSVKSVLKRFSLVRRNRILKKISD